MSRRKGIARYILTALTVLIMTAGPVMADTADITLLTGGSRPAELNLVFEPDWFTRDARVYNHALARTTLCFSIAAFDLDSRNPERVVRSFYGKLGFEDVSCMDYPNPSRDTIGTAIAHRTLETESGSVNLVALAFRAGNYGEEWVSNFDLGADGVYHKGFYESALKGVERLERYLERHGIDDPVFWVTGYSRAAACANIAAALLNERGLAADERIYAYTFATPATVLEEGAAGHDNIWNIINAADLVPRVPLAAWGFTRFGTTLILPTSACDAYDYAALLPDYLDTYRRLNGAGAIESGDTGFARTAQKAAEAMAILLPDRESYLKGGYDQMFSDLTLGREMNSIEQIKAFSAITVMANYIGRDSGLTFKVTDAYTKLNDMYALVMPAFGQHMPGIYLAWMYSADEKVILPLETIGR